MGIDASKYAFNIADGRGDRLCSQCDRKAKIGETPNPTAMAALDNLVVEVLSTNESTKCAKLSKEKITQ